MEGDDRREVEGDLTAVVADEPTAGAVDLAGVELGGQLDVAFGEHSAELAGGDGLGEGGVEGGCVGDLYLVADAALGEVPVGQEAELERGDRALDRHVDHVHDQPATIEGGERGTQGGGAFRCVKGEDLLHPPRAGETLGLFGHQSGAGGDDEDVVGEGGTAGEVHLVGLDVDMVDAGLDEPDPVVELPFPGAHDVLGVGEAERDEQQPRLVDVAVVLVDHDDLGLLGGQRRRKRLAVRVPPVPPPRITIREVMALRCAGRFQGHRTKGPL